MKAVSQHRMMYMTAECQMEEAFQTVHFNVVSEEVNLKFQRCSRILKMKTAMEMKQWDQSFFFPKCSFTAMMMVMPTSCAFSRHDLTRDS